MFNLMVGPTHFRVKFNGSPLEGRTYIFNSSDFQQIGKYYINHIINLMLIIVAGPTPIGVKIEENPLNERAL